MQYKEEPLSSDPPLLLRQLWPACADDVIRRRAFA